MHDRLVSDSSQGSGSPPARPANAPRAPAAPAAPRGVTPPVRPKPPAAPTGGIRPRAVSTHDAVPEARRAREPLPDEATVPMRRSDRPPSMPPEDAWGGEEKKDASAAETREVPAQAASPKPAPVAAAPAAAAASPKPAAVVTDANALRAALEEVLGPMQRSLDDLTVRIARERVDRKEAIEKLERVLARVTTATPPPVAPVAAVPPVAPVAAAAPPPAPVPAAAPQPFAVSPSSRPPPVTQAASPAAPPVAPSPAPAAVAKPPSPAPPPAVPTEAPSQPLNLDVIEAAPRRIELEHYSTDLGFDLPPGLDGSRRKKFLAWAVAVILLGGVIAIITMMIVSRSRGPGAL